MFPLAPNALLYYRLEVSDRQGRLLRRTRLYRSHSFVEQYAQHLRAWFRNSNESSVVDTGGTSRTILNPSSGANVWMQVIANAAAAANYGIRVGTGTTAVAMTNRQLATLIADGVGAGQLDYGGTTVGAHAQSGAAANFTLSRTFANTSGASITVREIGIACYTVILGPTDTYHLLVRDVLGTAVAVGDGQTLSVSYTIRIQV